MNDNHEWQSWTTNNIFARNWNSQQQGQAVLKMLQLVNEELTSIIIVIMIVTCGGDRVEHAVQ